MRFYKILIGCTLFIALSSYIVFHKYYISNTQIEYVKEKESVQIITRIFIDDFENVLKERYDDSLTFDDENTEDTNDHLESIDHYIEKYISEKFKIKIDDVHKQHTFLGKKIELGIVKCYLEILDVNQINTLEVSNQILFDLYSEQQNIVKLNINSKKKSFVLTKQNAKAVLNFD